MCRSLLPGVHFITHPDLSIDTSEPKSEVSVVPCYEFSRSKNWCRRILAPLCYKSPYWLCVVWGGVRGAPDFFLPQLPHSGKGMVLLTHSNLECCYGGQMQSGT